MSSRSAKYQRPFALLRAAGGCQTRAVYFVVIREQGRAWNASLAMREQEQWPEHVEFTNGIADEGFLIVAGPVGDGNPYRAMLVVGADDEGQVAAGLEDDPWTTVGVLETKSVERWEVLVVEFVST
jgi:uncharacterized protein